MRSRNGFTLIELLLVIAIVAVLATVSFVSISSYGVSNTLQRTGEEVAAAFRNTRQRSMSQENGTAWGMHFSNATSGNTYTSFGGTSYASSTSRNAYTLGNGISFGNPPTSTSVDVLFNPLTGYPNQSQIVSLVDGRRDGLVYDVAVNSLGSVEGNFWQGLVGYWPLDEGTGTTAYDASGNGNNGTLTNGPLWQSGSSCEVGNCLSFNGTSNYISLPSGIYFSGPFTVTGWVYVRSYNTWSRLLDFGNGASSDNVLFAISQSSSGDAYLESWNGGTRGFSLSSGSPIPLNQWVFLAGVADGNNAAIYKNGQLWTSMATTFTSTGVTRTTNYIGRSNWSADSYANALFDDIRIYNRALSAQDIQDLYNETQ